MYLVLKPHDSVQPIGFFVHLLCIRNDMVDMIQVLGKNYSVSDNTRKKSAFRESFTKENAHIASTRLKYK